MANAYSSWLDIKQGQRGARIRQQAEHAYHAMLLLLDDYKRDCPEVARGSIAYALMVQEAVDGVPAKQKEAKA